MISSHLYLCTSRWKLRRLSITEKGFFPLPTADESHRSEAVANALWLMILTVIQTYEVAKYDSWSK